MSTHWYVLQTKVHKEEILWQRLRARGYEVFYPRLFVHQKRSNSLKIKPYFPRYLFVRLNLDQICISNFQWMPDAVGLIGFGEKPAYVPDQFIQAIQDHLKKVASLGEKLLVGFDDKEESLIIDGYLGTGDFPGAVWSLNDAGISSSYQAIFDSRLPGKERVRALYQLLREKST